MKNKIDKKIITIIVLICILIILVGLFVLKLFDYKSDNTSSPSVVNTEVINN